MSISSHVPMHARFTRWSYRSDIKRRPWRCLVTARRWRSPLARFSSCGCPSRWVNVAQKCRGKKILLAQKNFHNPPKVAQNCGKPANRRDFRVAPCLTVKAPSPLRRRVGRVTSISFCCRACTPAKFKSDIVFIRRYMMSRACIFDTRIYVANSNNVGIK